MIEGICMYSIKINGVFVIHKEVLHYSIHQNGSVLAEDSRGKIIKIGHKPRGNFLEHCLQDIISEFVLNATSLPWEMKIEKYKSNIDFREETYDGYHYQITFSF